MISVSEAIGLVLANVAPLETEEIPPGRAAGRILAADLPADRDYPPFDRVMMDGYAVRASDLALAGPGNPVELALAGEAAAGSVYGRPLRPGEAIKVMTGAPLPEGADSVVQVEASEPAGPGRVRLSLGVRPGQNVDPRGGHLRAGEAAARAGRRLNPELAGALATVGAVSVRAWRLPAAALLSTGSELVDPAARPLPHQIRDSNTAALQALLAGEGFPLASAARVGDELDATIAAIERGLEADALVLTGGVSMGDYDYVGRALAALGARTIFHKVRLRPGKPVLFALRGAKPVFGLPGNPVSVLVTARLFLLPALRRMAGWEAAACPAPRLPGVAGGPSPWKRRGVEAWLPARRRMEAGRVVLEAAPWKGSGDVFGACEADCLAIVPEGEDEIRPGEALEWSPI